MQRISVLSTFTSCLALVALVTAGLGCSSTQGSASTDPEGVEFVAPSEQLGRQIDVKAVEAEFWRSLDDFVALGDWFHGVGEPAYEALIGMASGTSVKAQQVAMSVIASRADRRLLARFKSDVKRPTDPSQLMSYARALMAMGDFTEAPVLIDALDDPVPRTRALAHQALERATNNDIPFDPNGSAEVRAQTVSIWRRWFSAQTGDPLLEPEADEPASTEVEIEVEPAEETPIVSSSAGDA